MSGSFNEWKENKMSMRRVTRLKVMVLYGIADQKLQAEDECQILLDEGERGVRQAGRWVAADSSEVWDKKARSEGALCKGERVGREGKQEQALKQWKMRSQTPGVLGDDSPSGAIQTFHKAQYCGYSKIICSE